MGYRPQAGEQAAAPYFLEVTLAYVLLTHKKKQNNKYYPHIQPKFVLNMQTPHRKAFVHCKNCMSTHQHGGAQVKLLGHLRDISVN